MVGEIRWRWGHVLSSVATVVVLLAGVLAAPVTLRPEPAVFAGATGRLAFERGGDIWTANGDGTNQVRLTVDAAMDAQPSWSPDGRRIAFVSNRPTDTGAPHLYVMNADGTDQHQVGTEGAWTPTWSPDGRLLYQVVPEGKLHLINADGTGVVALTNGPGHDSYPSWSPDGTRIAFASDRSGNYQVHVMDADGTDVQRLTTSSAQDVQPDWSADGSLLAFTRSSASGDTIFTMRPDGTAPAPLAAGAGASGLTPRWSPDGTRLAVTFDDGGTPNIEVMRSDGSRRARVLTDASAESWQPVTPVTGRLVFYSNESPQRLWTANPDGSDQRLLIPGEQTGFDAYPAWSPDGGKVAFLSARGGGFSIWVVDADGTDLHEVGGTPSPSPPAWSPDGSRLAYSSGNGMTAPIRIRIIDLDGSNDAEVPGQSEPAIFPAWSPDGQRIAFTSDPGIRVMDADGSNPVQLTTEPDDDTPDWSPDGRLIAFSRSGDVHVMAPDGTGVRDVTGTADPDEVTPKWSPDGSRIAFLAYPDAGSSYVATMDADDGGDRQTATGVPATWIDWQPSETLAPATTSSFSVSDVAVPEGDTGAANAVFTVTLSPSGTAPSTVHYATSSGSAAAGSDYTAISGDLTFDAGVTTRTIAVPVHGDTLVEPDETFSVVLSAPTGETALGDATGVGTITNNDVVPSRPVRVAAVGVDSQLYTANGYGGAFRAEGGVVRAGPAVARVPKPDGSALALEVVTGQDRRLYAKREGAGAWARLSNTAICDGSPAAFVAPTGTSGAHALVVACMGADRALWYDVAPITATATPVMDSFESLGGILTAGPAVATVQGALTFLVRGNDGRVYVRGTSGVYAQTGWFCQGHPALSSWGTTAYFACAGNDSKLYWARNDGSGWGGTQGLGGIARGGPGLAVTPDEAVMFIRGADDAVWQISVSPTRGNTQFSRMHSTVLYEVGATAL